MFEAIERRVDWYDDCGMADLSGDEMESEGRIERCISLAAHLEAATDIVTIRGRCNSRQIA